MTTRVRLEVKYDMARKILSLIVPNKHGVDSILGIKIRPKRQCRAHKSNGMSWWDAPV